MDANVLTTAPQVPATRASAEGSTSPPARALTVGRREELTVPELGVSAWMEPSSPGAAAA